MLAVINFEFLLSPILSSSRYFENLVDEIRILSELIQDGNSKFLVEEDSVMKMIDNKLFPSTKIYQEVISQLDEEPPYGAEDIVRLVNSILSKASAFETADRFTHIIEWMTFGVLSPKIHSINHERCLQLESFYESLIIENKLADVKYSPLYFHPETPSGKQELYLAGEVKNFISSNDERIPCNFDSSIDLYFCLSEYLCSLDGYAFFKSAETMAAVKFSFYVGAMKVIKDNAYGFSLGWDDFKIGEDFINSIAKNECYQEQKFSSVLYESIVYILARHPKNEVDFFYKKEDPAEPRRVGKYVAHRTHITKSGRGLRLLMWIDETSGVVIFSNVGNKNELVIENP